MITAVPGLIEQVGSVIKEFQNTIIINQPHHNFVTLQRASTDTCQQANLYQFIGSYHWTIASRWMHMNWCMLASKQVSQLAL